MTFAEKIEKLIKQKGTTQAAVERAALLAENRLAKLKKSGEPVASEILRLSKVLDVSPEYLIDDAVKDPRPGEVLTSQETTILNMFRTLTIDFKQLMQAMTDMAKPGVPVVGAATAKESLVRESGRAKRPN